MKHFSRINNHDNRNEAEIDWIHISVKAMWCGYAAIVRDITPAQSATVKKYDAAIAELRKRIAGDGI